MSQQSILGGREDAPVAVRARMDTALLRALATPRKPHETSKKSPKESQSK